MIVIFNILNFAKGIPFLSQTGKKRRKHSRKNLARPGKKSIPFAFFYVYFFFILFLFVTILFSFRFFFISFWKISREVRFSLLSSRLGTFCTDTLEAHSSDNTTNKHLKRRLSLAVAFLENAMTLKHM